MHLIDENDQSLFLRVVMHDKRKKGGWEAEEKVTHASQGCDMPGSQQRSHLLSREHVLVYFSLSVCVFFCLKMCQGVTFPIKEM